MRAFALDDDGFHRSQFFGAAKCQRGVVDNLLFRGRPSARGDDDCGQEHDQKVKRFPGFRGFQGFRFQGFGFWRFLGFRFRGVLGFRGFRFQRFWFRGFWFRSSRWRHRSPARPLRNDGVLNPPPTANPEFGTGTLEPLRRARIGRPLPVFVVRVFVSSWFVSSCLRGSCLRVFVVRVFVSSCLRGSCLRVFVLFVVRVFVVISPGSSSVCLSETRSSQ